MRPMKHKEKEDGKEKPQVKSSHCYVRNDDGDDDEEEENDDDDQMFSRQPPSGGY